MGVDRGSVAQGLLCPGDQNSEPDRGRISKEGQGRMERATPPAVPAAHTMEAADPEGRSPLAGADNA